MDTICDEELTRLRLAFFSLASIRRPVGKPLASAGPQTCPKTLSRTNSTNHLAWFWQPGFFQEWLAQVDLEIFQNHLTRILRVPPCIRIRNHVQHDAMLACWDIKYAYLELLRVLDIP